MKLNLAQMQAAQRAFESFDMVMENHDVTEHSLYKLRPVFKYNGHLIMGDLYELDNLRKEPNVVEFKIGNDENLKHTFASPENAVSNSSKFFTSNLYKSISNDPSLAFKFVADKLPEWEKSEALPTRFIKNVKCLDGTMDKSIKFLELENPIFDWISLAPKN
ncbi:hypothetical protein [Apilactobacillus timberlakei]|uniref:hypothetical protein n=1 Tax=Apilactobacillus timberlakei TaxID=2008380 RepID=UPI00112D846D|nr:hypothetical protein [Apilactobacillus timberlakei]TPR16677.1 hypothetical protein DYZ95_07490 [Apilactobacillus timberlakei]